MLNLKLLISRYSHPFLKPFSNPNQFITKTHPILKSYSNFFFSQIPNSISHPFPPKPTKNRRFQKKNKRQLDVLFKEALGLCEREQSLENLGGKSDQIGGRIQNLENLSRNQGVHGEKVQSLGKLSGEDYVSGDKIQAFGNQCGKKNKSLGSVTENKVEYSGKIQTLENVGGNDCNGGSIQNLGNLSRKSCINGERIQSLRPLSGKKGELQKKLWELELEIKDLKENSGENKRILEGIDAGVSGLKGKTLCCISGGEVEEGENSTGLRKVEVFNEISKDVEMLLRHMYDKGYFKNVKFLQGNTFDVSCFDELYARNYVKSALDRFGNDHQEISERLSNNDMKVIALFGCPALDKRVVFAAKKLRMFFKIEEQSVCSKCVLKDSCKYVNQSIWKSDNTSIRLASLLKLLRTYSLEDIPPGLKLTDDLKACVSRLIHEVVHLTKGVSQAVSNGNGNLAGMRKS